MLVWRMGFRSHGLDTTRVIVFDIGLEFQAAVLGLEVRPLGYAAGFSHWEYED